MTRRLRRQDGFTIVEVLLVCSISVIVLGATLSAWTAMVNASRGTELQRDNVESARVAMDRAARLLRNLANPSVNAVTTIDRAEDYDFIFQTSDPAKTWVRYCLKTDGTASPAQGVLWESESATANLTAGMRGPCPGSGWTTSRMVVQSVSNRVGGIDRNVFDYACTPVAPAGCPASTAEYPKITSVSIDLWVDAKPADRVGEMHVSSGVYLRNQNEAPTAMASVSRLGTKRVLLNGAGSSDPEGRTLEYFWFEGTAPTADEIKNTPCTAPYPNTAWRGVTYDKTFDTGAIGEPRTFHLLVRDPGCLTAMTSITTTIPA